MPWLQRFGRRQDADLGKLIKAIACGQPPRFFGIVDRDGFNSFNFSTGQLGVLETGGVPGDAAEPGFSGPLAFADNFTFTGMQAVPEPRGWAAMLAGLSLIGLRLGRRLTNNEQ